MRHSSFSPLFLLSLVVSIGSMSFIFSAPDTAGIAVKKTTIAKKKNTAQKGKAPSKKNVADGPFVYTYGNNTFTWKNTLRYDGFYSKNCRMLNNDNGTLDKTVTPGKFFLDSKMTNVWRNAKKKDVYLVTAGLRARGMFGPYKTGSMLSSEQVRDLGAKIGSHTHYNTTILPTVRELWLQINWPEVLHLPTEYDHTFTVGSFPFALGRGIALGTAYGVSADNLNTDSDASVDQYAPGFKFSGDLMRDHMMRYDLYAEVSQNRSSNFGQVNTATKDQLYGKLYNQARDFGMVDYILAGRLQFTPLNFKDRRLMLEPYCMYNYAPEGFVNVSEDSITKLRTAGIATEASVGQWEFGFDTAFNFGYQEISGVDRNSVNKQMDTASNPVTSSNIRVGAYANSKVVQYDGNKTTVKGGVLAPNTSDNQKYITMILRPAFDQPNSNLSNFNKLQYDVYDKTGNYSYTLANKADRFVDPKVTRFGGSMFVCDVAYNFVHPDVKLALSTGITTGDTNPNMDRFTSGDSRSHDLYKAFVSVQESYSGTRVKSAYFMSGFGGAPRVTSVAIDEFEDIAEQQATAVVSRFNNLLFVGASLQWSIEKCWCSCKIQPNFLAYWSDIPPNKLTSKASNPTISETIDAAENDNIIIDEEESADEDQSEADATGDTTSSEAEEEATFNELDQQSSDEFENDTTAPESQLEEFGNIFSTTNYGRKYLGSELNIYIDVDFAKNFKGFLIAGIFVPGTFYEDLTGVPLSRSEKAFLQAGSTSGAAIRRAPFLADHTALFMNAGITYMF